LNIDTEVIILSLASAFVHGVLELIFLNLEAKACKTGFIHYFSICFTGRLGWVPFTNQFDSVSSGSDVDLNNVLDYDNMSSSLCGAKMSVEFEFTDQTIQVLIKSLSCLPIEPDEDSRLKVKIGPCISKIDFDLFRNLIVIGY